MHALNGNIFFSVSADTPRCDAVGNAVTKGLAPATHKHVYQQPEGLRLHAIQEEVPKLTYGMTTSAGVSLTSVPPSRHQLCLFLDNLTGEPAYNHGTLTLTTAGAEISRIIDDPTVKDGRVNSAFTKQVWRYLASCPLLHYSQH